jgi:serine/threonine protein kinase
MIVGFPPFYDATSDQSKLFDRIRQKQISFPPKRYGIPMSPEAKDFIKRLCDKDPKTRLGSEKDMKEILDHPWLSCVNVNALLDKQVIPPYKPEKPKNPLDVSKFDTLFTNEEAVLTMVDLQLGVVEQKKFKEDF